MFILMPFVCSQGGWVEVYNGKEISLCSGRVGTYNESDVAYAKATYSGSANNVERNWNINSDPLFRVQTQHFTKEMWKWFMEEARYRMGCNYIEDGCDVYMTDPKLPPEFAYPMEVLNELIREELITNKNIIMLKERREKEEALLGKAPINHDERISLEDSEIKKKEEIAKSKIKDMEQAVDPTGEFKSGKSKKLTKV